MIVGVQGSPEFEDYNVFLRAMAVAISAIPKGDPSFILYSAGPANINGYVAGFSNITENSLKKQGIRNKFRKVPHQWMADNADSIDYFIFLSKPNEHMSRLAKTLDDAGVEVGWFKF